MTWGLGVLDQRLDADLLPGALGDNRPSVQDDEPCAVGEQARSMEAMITMVSAGTEPRDAAISPSFTESRALAGSSSMRQEGSPRRGVCQGDSLPLPAGEGRVPVADQGVEALEGRRPQR